MNDLTLPDLFSRDPLAALLRDPLLRMRLPLSDLAPSIPIDLSETDAEYVIKADIPGMRKEDLQLRVDGDMVTISVSAKRESEKRDGGRVLWNERTERFASRSFSLDHPVSEAKAQAQYRDGVLTVHLPKTGEPRAHRVAIQ